MSHPRRLQTRHFFPNELWIGGDSLGRSRELTPLFIDRYHGPHGAVRLTSHDYWDLTCVLSGVGTLCGATPLPLSPHSVALIPAGYLHDQRSEAEMTSLWIGLRGTRLSRLPGQAPRLLCSADLAGEIDRLATFSRQQGQRVGPELDAMTSAILAKFFRLLTEGEERKPRKSEVVQKAIRFFDRHFSEPIAVADLARKLGCSERHFDRLFHRDTGLTPTAYLQRTRLRHGCHLLRESGLRIQEIAGLCGYENAYYFSRIFQQNLGVSPSGYRKSLA